MGYITMGEEADIFSSLIKAGGEFAQAAATRASARSMDSVAKKGESIESISASTSRGAITAAKEELAKQWEAYSPFIYGGAALAALYFFMPKKRKR